MPQPWRLAPALLALLKDQAPEQWYKLLKGKAGLTAEGPSATVEDGLGAIKALKGPLLEKPIRAELAALVAGVKPALREVLYPQDQERTLSFAKEKGLAVLQAWPHVTAREAHQGGQGGQAGGAVWYLGRDPALLEKLRAAEGILHTGLGRGFRTEAEREVGLLLGYPACCVDAFLAVDWPRENPALRAAAHANTHAGFFWELNQLCSMAPHLTSHFPCSYNCEPSLAYVKRVLEVPDIARAFEDPRLFRAMSGVHFYLTDRFQIWFPSGRPDLAQHPQVFAARTGQPPYGDPVDGAFMASVVLPFRRAQSFEVRGKTLKLSLPEGEITLMAKDQEWLLFDFTKQ